jgi:hypothetical protein
VFSSKSVEFLMDVSQIHHFICCAVYLLVVPVNRRNQVIHFMMSSKGGLPRSGLHPTRHSMKKNTIFDSLLSFLVSAAPIAALMPWPSEPLAIRMLAGVHG